MLLIIVVPCDFLRARPFSLLPCVCIYVYICIVIPRCEKKYIEVFLDLKIFQGILFNFVGSTLKLFALEKDEVKRMFDFEWEKVILPFVMNLQIFQFRVVSNFP